MTTEIKLTLKGHSVFVDGSYNGSFRSRSKADKYVGLLTGKPSFDVALLMHRADAADARFARQ